MSRSWSRSRFRSRRPLGVGVVAAVLLAACASGPAGPLATIDGEEVPRELLEGWVRSATAANDEADPVGLQADLLSAAIQTRIFESLLAERGLSIDPVLIDEARAALVERFGGDLALQAVLLDAGFPEAFFEDVILRQQAAVDTLAIHLADGRTLETRTARHILVLSSDEADEVYELLLAGADFAVLAEERSQDVGSGAMGGMLGPSPRGVYVPPFDDAVWAAALDTVLEPVESQYGFHIIEVLEATTLTAVELDSQGRQSLVAEELAEIIGGAFESVQVVIDPTIGTWDAIGGRVLPVGASN